jgi:hypothetical protein
VLFPYPALRLRLRAGLSCFVPSGLWGSRLCYLILARTEMPRAKKVKAPTRRLRSGQTFDSVQNEKNQPTIVYL